MKKFIKTILLGGALALSVLAPNQAHATPGPVETAVTDAVNDAKTAGENVLGVAATVVAGFLIFKLAKRAANKA